MTATEKTRFLGVEGERLAAEVLAENGYENVSNLNHDKTNYPFADLYAEKDGKKFVISVKTRNKYTKYGALNSSYNLGSNAYENAEFAKKDKGAEAYWMGVQIDRETFSIFFGSLDELAGKEQIPVKLASDGQVGICLVEDRPHSIPYAKFGNAAPSKEIEQNSHVLWLVIVIILLVGYIVTDKLLL